MPFEFLVSMVQQLTLDWIFSTPIFYHFSVKFVNLFRKQSLLIFSNKNNFTRNRPHTAVKNAINMTFLSHLQAKLPFFEEIFKLWTHEQQELPFLQTFISFANQNIAVLYMKRISFFLKILMLQEVYFAPNYVKISNQEIVNNSWSWCIVY